MGQQVVGGATLKCSFGTGTGMLNVIRPMLSAEAMPAANIMDNKPMVNITGFIMCQSLSNPTVASATAAALGVLTPMPCLPVVPAPWAPGSATVSVEKMPALNNSSKCNCAYGGLIEIVKAGTTKTTIP